MLVPRENPRNIEERFNLLKRTLVVSVFSILAVLALSLAASANVLSSYGATTVVPTPGSPGNLLRTLREAMPAWSCRSRAI